MSLEASSCPPYSLVAVTPSDTVNLVQGITRGLYVGASGNVKVIDAVGTTVTLNGLVAGVFHPVRVKRVFATDTTATGIVALY